MKKIDFKYYAEFMLLIVTLLWGATFTIVKESLNNSSPILFISLRFSLASLFLIPFIIKNKVYISKSSVKAGFVLGILMFFSFAAQTIGLKYTTATKSGFITGSLVVMIPMFQIIIEKKKPSLGAFIGVALVFVGILFLSSGGNSIFTFLEDIGANFNVGDFFTLVCAILFAIHVVYLDVFSKKENTFVLFSFQIFTTAIFGIIFTFMLSLANYEKIHFVFSESLIFGLLYTSIFATLITTSLQTKYQKSVSPTKAGLIYSFEPIFAALIAFFALSEKITNFGLLGCALIFLGLISSELIEYYSNGREK